MILLAVGMAGLLVVFALLAFVYAPRIFPAAAPPVVVIQPAQMDNSAAMDQPSTVDTGSDADLVSSSSQHSRYCDGVKFENSGY